MPLAMNAEVFVTCAVTGSGGTQDKSRHVPRSPAEIAASAIEAARAGAAIVHCHVRDPETGRPARDPRLYREVVERIRASETDVVINLTAGMGGDIITGPPDRPVPLGPGTDMAGAAERVAHVLDSRPEICTLDCGTMNFAEADYIMANTPGMLEDMARRMAESGARIEIEAFDTGHLWLAQDLVRRGVIPEPVLVQLCMGVPWGAPDDLNTFMAMVNNVPKGWTLLGLLDRPERDGLCRGGRAGRRQRPGRARGQPLSRPRRAGDERSTRGKGCDHRRGDGRPHHRTGRGPRAPEAAEAVRRLSRRRARRPRASRRNTLGLRVTCVCLRPTGRCHRQAHIRNARH